MTKNSYMYVTDLGKGTFGDVVLAKDGNGQFYAIKCLRLDSITKRTPMEISNHKKLQHPYIIQFKEVFSDENGLYIVMEFASKGDLLTHIQNKPLCRLDEGEARWYFQQLIISLDYIHRMAVGHRDLKLENVLLAENPTDPHHHVLKLADFGFAADHVSTKANSKVGTYSYMAPEVFTAGHSSPTATRYNPKRADIWSCGVMLYNMLTGRHAFMQDLPPHLPKDQTGAGAKLVYQKTLKGCPPIPPGITISEPCLNLLTQLLTPEPHNRITIEGIMAHEWFKEGLDLSMGAAVHLAGQHAGQLVPAANGGQSDLEIAAVVDAALATARAKRHQAFRGATAAAAAAPAGAPGVVVMADPVHPDHHRG